MSDVDEIVEGLMTGRRRRIERDEAVRVFEAIAAEVDRGCAVRAEAGARRRLPVVCARGCNGCCEELVLVWLPEAIAIARWLMEPAQRDVRDRFVAAFPAWEKAVGDAPRRLAELRAARDGAAFLEAHRAQWGRRVLCAFNVDGDCAIYPVRPVSCRTAHAVETSARCSGANLGGRPAARLAFPPLDDYVAQADHVLRTAQAALGGDRRRAESLCTAVHRLVQSGLAAERKAARSRER